MKELESEKNNPPKIEIGPNAKEGALADAIARIQKSPEFIFEDANKPYEKLLLVDIQEAIRVLEQRYRSELRRAFTYEGKMAPRSFQEFQKLKLGSCGQTYKELTDTLLEQKRDEAKRNTISKPARKQLKRISAAEPVGEKELLEMNTKE